MDVENEKYVTNCTTSSQLYDLLELFSLSFSLLVGNVFFWFVFDEYKDLLTKASTRGSVSNVNISSLSPSALSHAHFF